MNTAESKAETIAESAFKEAEARGCTGEMIYESAACALATACALLTSTSKAEREEGKTMVRRWKNGNSF